MKMVDVYTEKAPRPVGPYTQAVLAEGRFLFVSGQIPIDTETGEVVDGSIAEQAEVAIRNMLSIVEAAGGSAGNIVKVTVYLADIQDYQEFNRVYEKYFSNSKPARAVVGVSGLPKGVKVELECVAVL